MVHLANDAAQAVALMAPCSNRGKPGKARLQRVLSIVSDIDKARARRDNQCSIENIDDLLLALSRMQRRIRGRKHVLATL
jgi:hypothetical protein